MIGVLILAGVVAVAGVAAPGGLDGRWVLVEESYGDGAQNLTGDDNRVWIEFRGNAARTWFRDPAGSGLAWPAFPDETGPLPVSPLEIRLDPAAGVADAHYRVSQDPVGGLELVIHERYRVADGGDALTGTVTVTFVRDGRETGSFEMHRRFERVP